MGERSKSDNHLALSLSFYLLHAPNLGTHWRMAKGGYGFSSVGLFVSLFVSNITLKTWITMKFYGGGCGDKRKAD